MHPAAVIPEVTPKALQWLLILQLRSMREKLSQRLDDKNNENKGISGCMIHSHKN